MRARRTGDGDGSRNARMRARLAWALVVVLTVATGSVTLGQDSRSSAAPSAEPELQRPVAIGGPGSLEWRRALGSEQGPGEAWIEHALGGVVAVFQPVGQPAELWRSSDGIRWQPLEPPADLGVVNDLLSTADGLTLITDEVRADDLWTFDVWSTADGVEWRRPGNPSTLAAYPDLAGRTRTILGIHSVRGGLVAFESYASTESVLSPSSASPRPESDPARVFVWRSSDGRAWERDEVGGPGRDALAAGSRIIEGAEGRLDILALGRRPRLLTSTDGIQWEDAGAIGHEVEGPGGATAIATTRDDLLMVGRSRDPEPGVQEWAISRGPLGGHWIEMHVLPPLSNVELLVDGRVGIAAGTAPASGDAAAARGTRSFLATSADRGWTWQEQPDVAQRDLCLGPLTSIGEVALLGSGCSPDGGMSVLAARLDSYVPVPKPPETSIPTAPQALECDFRRSRQGTGPGIYGEGDPGYADSREAMQGLVREDFTVPRSGYRELARDELGVLYGYRHKGKVKVAVRVVAGRARDDGWVAERLSSCRIFEFGAKADMGPGVWLWANRWDRTVQERRGPAHCDWESTRFLSWAPPGTPETLRATKLYVRDPKGVFRDRWAVPFSRSTTLPSDARYTGYRRDGRALWLASDGRAMYVKDGDKVERWPKIPTGTGCA